MEIDTVDLVKWLEDLDAEAPPRLEVASHISDLHEQIAILGAFFERPIEQFGISVTKADILSAGRVAIGGKNAVEKIRVRVDEMRSADHPLWIRIGEAEECLSIIEEQLGAADLKASPLVDLSEPAVDRNLPKPIDVTRSGYDLADYYLAPSGAGKLAGVWDDKPHRLLYELIGYARLLKQAVRDASLDAPKKEALLKEIEGLKDKVQTLDGWAEGLKEALDEEVSRNAALRVQLERRSTLLETLAQDSLKVRAMVDGLASEEGVEPEAVEDEFGPSSGFTTGGTWSV